LGIIGYTTNGENFALWETSNWRSSAGREEYVARAKYVGLHISEGTSERFLYK
jgi:hypothetical protein